MQTFKLSYTQRLSRPGIWQLNPFKDSSTPMQLVYGNPNLESEISHTFSLGYTLFTAKGLNLATELNGRIQNNGIEQTIFMDEDGVANVTYDNIGKARECNLNVFFREISFLPSASTPTSPGDMEIIAPNRQDIPTKVGITTDTSAHVGTHGKTVQ